MAYSQPTNSWPESAKAGIYSTKEVPPLKAMLLALAPTAQISEGHEGDATNFTCEWPAVAVRFTLKPGWNGSEQRAAMKHWISGLPAGNTNTPATWALLRKIDSTVNCVGCVITPGYDSAGKASSLVLGLAAKLDGYVFSRQSFYDTTGARIIGVSNAPPNLKERN